MIKSGLPKNREAKKLILYNAEIIIYRLAKTNKGLYQNPENLSLTPLGGVRF